MNHCSLRQLRRHLFQVSCLLFAALLEMLVIPGHASAAACSGAASAQVRAVCIATADARVQARIALRDVEVTPKVKPSGRSLSPGGPQTLSVTFTRADSDVVVVLAEVSPDGRHVIQVRGQGINIMPGQNPYEHNILSRWWPWMISLAALMVLLAGHVPAHGARWWWFEGGLLVGFGVMNAAFVTLTDNASPSNILMVARLQFGIAYLLLLLVAIRLYLRAIRPGGTSVPVPRRWLPNWVVVVIVLALVLGRGVIALFDPAVSDVGIAGVNGAERLLGSAPIYGFGGQIPGYLIHGDTYAPLNYIAYVPAYKIVQLFGSHPDYEHVAVLTALVADAICVLLCFLCARRFAGTTRAGLLSAGLWVAMPSTTFALVTATNDAVMVAFVLAALLTLASPVRRGLLLAAAVGVKFAPLVAVPALLRVNGERMRSSAPRAIFAGMMIVLVCFAYILRYQDGLENFLDATLRYQAKRDDIASMWGLLHAGWMRNVLAPLVLVACAPLAWWPRRNRTSAVTIAAVGATLALTQLVLRQWWFAYVLWFLGPMVVAMAVGHSKGIEPSPPARRDEAMDDG